MGRPQTWNEPDLLAAVMAVFREKGFSQTTLRDIGRATGLHPGSIYQAYGSKDGLFAATLRAYCERVVASRVQEHLVQSDDPVQGIRSFFHSTFDERPRSRQGCLITNTAIEGFSLEPKARSAVAAGLEAIERGLEAALVRAQEHGQIAASAPVRRLAAQLLALYQGVLVLVRAGSARDKLTAITDDGLQSIITKKEPKR